MVEKSRHEVLEERFHDLEVELLSSRQAVEKAEQATQERNAILDSLLEHVVYHDLDMHVMWANQAACDSVGLTREDVIGRHCHSIWAGRKSPCEDCPVAKAKDTGKPETVEKMTPDGRWWYVKGYPIRDIRGRVQGMTEVALDITDQKRAQKALEESRGDLERKIQRHTGHLLTTTARLKTEIEEREIAQQALQKSKAMLSKVFEAIDDLLVVIDKDLRVVMSNWKDHDYVPEQKRKKGLFCYSSFMGRDGPCEFCPAFEVFETGNMKEVEVVNSLDGRTRNLRIVPIFDDQGNVEMLVEHLRDVTERKQREEALQDRERALNAILAGSPAGIGLVRDRVILWANRAMYRMLGYEEGALKGVNAREVYANREEYERVGRELYPVVKTEGIADTEATLLAKDGRTFQSHSQLTALDPGDLSKGFIVTVMDISDRKRAESQIRNLSHRLLQAQELEWHRLACDLHDHLAQELSALKIGVDTFCERYQEVPPSAREGMSQLSKGLAGVISGVRDLAYDLRPPSLDELGIVDTLEQYCQDCSAKYDIEIEFFPVGVIESVLSRDVKITIYRLVQEAISNVRKHADADRVMVRLISSHPNTILRIEDDGKGFDVGASMAEAGQEKRLGLLGMKERVALLNGKISISSQPGQGTKIFVELPYGEKYRER